MTKKENELVEEVNQVENEAIEGEVVEVETVLVFKRPYRFEGKTYESVDLSGFENLTGRDMIIAQRTLERSGSTSFLPEMTLKYACVLASRATEYPIEFFEGFNPKESIRLKNMVTGFLYS